MLNAIFFSKTVCAGAGLVFDANLLNKVIT